MQETERQCNVVLYMIVENRKATEAATVSHSPMIKPEVSVQKIVDKKVGVPASLVLQSMAQQLAATRQAVRHRTGGPTEQSRRLFIRLALQVAQNQGRSVFFRQTVQLLFENTPQLPRFDFRFADGFGSLCRSPSFVLAAAGGSLLRVQRGAVSHAV